MVVEEASILMLVIILLVDYFTFILYKLLQVWSS